MKKVRVGGREYLEIPEDLRDKRIVVMRLGDSLYLVGGEEEVRALIRDRVRYAAQRTYNEKRRPRVIKAPTSWDKGYWVFDTETEAVNFSRRHSEDFQSGNILGIRGFDGRFYAIRASLYHYYLPKILDLLKTRPMSVKEIAATLKKGEDLVKTILEVAREEGIVVEKVGGVYEYTG